MLALMNNDIGHNVMKRKVVIFDIDGTLADNSNRQHLLKPPYKDWKCFFESMVFDKPVKSIVYLYRAMVELDNIEIVIFTGRPDTYRQKTLYWLSEHVFGNETYPRIRMRKEGDYRADNIVKHEMLYEFLNDYGYIVDDIVFVVDDRKQVVDMWRSEGITCLQCAEGDF